MPLPRQGLQGTQPESQPQVANAWPAVFRDARPERWVAGRSKAWRQSKVTPQPKDSGYLPGVSGVARDAGTDKARDSSLLAAEESTFRAEDFDKKASQARVDRLRRRLEAIGR